MHLDNTTDYSHLQRSIDTLRSLGDRLSERNVDLRLNLHNNDLRQDSRSFFDRSHFDRNGFNFERSCLGMDRPNPTSVDRPISLERIMNERNHLGENQQRDQRLAAPDHRPVSYNDSRGMGLDRNLGLERNLTIDRLNLERSLAQNAERALAERNLNHMDRLNLDRDINHDRLNGAERLRSGLDVRGMNGDVVRSNHVVGEKYREYKSHLDGLRNMDSSNRSDGKVDDERGNTSSPSTPVSVGEAFHEEKVFGSKAELQLHTQAHMREAKPYKCSQCCKAFANSSYLSQHTRIHLGIKPYRCEICQRKFTQLSHLQQHIRTHTGDKPYKCRHPGCQKAFSQLSNLQSHSRCHQTDKPYKCNSCYKCFSDEPSLLEHIPKHKESKHLKTHICQYCGKSYTQETYLQKHMQKHAERTDKRPPIGPGLGLNHRALDHPYWPKVSPDSAENMHDYPNDIPRQILEQNEDLVIIRQQLGQNPPAPPSTPSAMNYDTTITKSNANSAFTPISSMSSHLNLNQQLAPNRPYLYDAISFQKQNSLDLQKSQASNGFPNQLISLHHIRNYAHQPNTSLMEHSILGGLKDK